MLPFHPVSRHIVAASAVSEEDKCVRSDFAAGLSLFSQSTIVKNRESSSAICAGRTGRIMSSIKNGAKSDPVTHTGTKKEREREGKGE